MDLVALKTHLVGFGRWYGMPWSTRQLKHLPRPQPLHDLFMMMVNVMSMAITLLPSFMMMMDVLVVDDTRCYMSRELFN